MFGHPGDDRRGLLCGFSSGGFVLSRSLGILARPCVLLVACPAIGCVIADVLKAPTFSHDRPWFGSRDCHVSSVFHSSSGAKMNRLRELIPLEPMPVTKMEVVRLFALSPFYVTISLEQSC